MKKECNYKLLYKLSTTLNNNSKTPRYRRGNIIWLNTSILQNIYYKWLFHFKILNGFLLITNFKIKINILIPEVKELATYIYRKRALFIIEYKGDNLLNQRNELISKCRHKN